MGMWWRNISPKSESIPIGNGNVVAARPQDVVEVEAETPALHRLKRQNKVARAGRPSNPTQAIRPAPVQGEVARKRADTEFAQRTMERGTVRGHDEARRAAEMAAHARVPAAEAELARRAAVKAAEEAKQSSEQAAAEPTSVAAEAEAVEAQVTDGTAEGSTMGKKSKRRWTRASE